MDLRFYDEMIPGTKHKRADMDGTTGLAFLKKVFLLSDKVMLTQIREISGIDSSTLQNWTKRGWVASSKLKKYDIDQVAHILIINMLRACMQLDHIDFLIHYINGDVESKDDDIIRDSVLYDYICRILERITQSGECDIASVREYVAMITADYVEPFDGARERLDRALEIIVITYYSALIKHRADELLSELRG